MIYTSEFKKLFFVCVLSLLFCSQSLFSAINTPKVMVDERVELISVVFRLAGAAECKNDKNRVYTKIVNDYFEPYKNHEAIQYAKKLRKERGISYDGPIRLAVAIEIDNGELSLIQGLKDNGYSKDGLDSRWDEESVTEFLSKLNDFYKDTKFDTFFNSNKELYTLYQQSFDSIINKINFNWFNDFFGTEPSEFVIIISETRPGGGYGPKLEFEDGKEVNYAILASGEYDSEGIPIYEDDFLPIVIHEFSHSYCNPLMDLYIDELEEDGKKIFEQVEDVMKNQTYPLWYIVLYENFVRACVIKYMEEDTVLNPLLADEVFLQKMNGFLWIDSTVAKLTEYEKNRALYPVMKDFLPEFVLQYKGLGEKLETVILNLPKVIGCSIEPDSKIEATTDRIVFEFDQPMNIESRGGFSKLNKNQKKFPKMTDRKWVDDRHFEVKMKLEENKEYSFQFFMRGFVNVNNDPMLDNYEVRFSTY